MQDPTTRRPVALDDARRIVADPQPGDSTLIRQLAWIALKNARGHTARQIRPDGDAA